ncbi:aminoglycoside phosphotransferase family protein [Streptomyces sp. NPDC051567]|uniref:aminoglycoside phosphotransferase family protein n=1 Tax=Streptomyces sp. NPDC051567 TaxID=3365660 RepID=UPI0037B83376
MDASTLYEKARGLDTGQSGHYNRNVRLETADGPVIVRMRTGGAEVMDLALWPEAEVLAAIGGYVTAAPRLLHAGRDPDFQIHGFVEGRRVDGLVPAGTRLPDAVLKGVEGLFGDLLRVPESALPALPPDWPQDGDTAEFAARLTGLVHEIRHRGGEGIDGLYEALGVPEDPCGPLRERARNMAGRRFGLLHADIHRQNMMLTDGGLVVFLDWELALWGDPVYDLADHLHKMSYSPEERHEVTEGWERAAPDECRAGWRDGLDHYLAYEAVKSAVVDTVRWGQRIARTEDGSERALLARELTDKLKAARPYWTVGAPDVPEPQEVEEAVARWVVPARPSSPHGR